MANWNWNWLGSIGLVAIASLGLPAASNAATLLDDFNGGSLDPAWIVTTNNVTDYKYSVASSKLTMSDADPAATSTGNLNSAISPTADSSYGDVFFTRALGASAADFTLDFDLSWDNTVAPLLNDAGGAKAMPRLYIRLLDASNQAVVRVGISDEWNTGGGGRAGTIDNTSVPFVAISSILTSALGDLITISRTGSNVTATWTGPGSNVNSFTYGYFPFNGTASAAVTQIQLQFSRFRLDGVTPQASLGELSVDKVDMEFTPVPEPASLGLLMLGAAMMLRRGGKDSLDQR